MEFNSDNMRWKDGCVSKLGDTTSICGNLNRQNDEHWILAHPMFGDDKPKLFDCWQKYQSCQGWPHFEVSIIQ